VKRAELFKLRDKHVIHSCEILTLLGSACMWIVTVWWLALNFLFGMY